MLAVVITATTVTKAIADIKRVDPAHICEWRLDYLENLDAQTIIAASKKCEQQIIITLRRKLEGGNYIGCEPMRQQLLLQLCQGNFCYIDIEHDVATAIIIQIKELNPTLKIIRSYHNFTHTPVKLEEVLQHMTANNIDFYKIVTRAHSVIDAMRLLIFIKNNKKTYGHCLGTEYFYSRYICRMLQPSISYANTGSKLDTIKLPTVLQYKLHGYNRTNQATKIYALLGNPIDQSPGATLHNNYFTEKNINAIYVLIQLNPTALQDFMPLCKQLPFTGFSVTRPLKCVILDYTNASKQHAVNTLLLNQHRWQSTNTDGAACVNLLKQTINLSHKKILILGAGGTACGIIQALSKHKPEIFIYNRTTANAEHLANLFNCTVVQDLTELQLKFDIIIGTLPPAAYHESYIKQLLDHCQQDSIIMDVNYQHATPPLHHLAQQKKATFIHGKKLFTQQALLQQIFWNAKKH